MDIVNSSVITFKRTFVKIGQMPQKLKLDKYKLTQTQRMVIS